ncbi:MAG: hypothetical protein RLZZ585_87 [Bacteroidota bacterium]|jgi:hypothetical protein
MSTILISSEFEKHSAAESVLNIFLLNNKVDTILISGKTKSSFDKKERFKKLFRYFFLFGPLFKPSLFFDIKKLLKSNDTIVLDSSHYNILIPFIRFFYPSVEIKVLYHNNEFLFLESALKYYLKSKEYRNLIMSILKLPYTSVIRIIELSSKVSIIYISTNDMKYASSKNNIEFLDLTPRIDFNIKRINISRDVVDEYYFIGNDFFNNKIQVEEFSLNFPTQKLLIYGNLSIQYNKNITLLGPYESEDNLPRNKKYFLGSNPTGFPIKSITYLNIPFSEIHSTQWLSLNLLVQPKVKYLEGI